MESVRASVVPSRVRARIHFAQERDAVRPSSSPWDVRRGSKKERARASFAGPKKGARARARRGGSRDRAQKKRPGETGGRKSRPLIGKSKFVLRKLSSAARENETERSMPLDYHKFTSAIIAATIQAKRKLSTFTASSRMPVEENRSSSRGFLVIY